MLFHHDNAPAHTSAIATAKLFALCYEILPHPPYSPDLAPSDYFLFPNMKTCLGGKRFSSNEEIIVATNEYFEGFDKTKIDLFDILNTVQFISIHLFLPEGVREYECTKMRRCC